MLRIRVLVAPYSDRPTPLDLFVGAFEPRQQRRWVGGEKGCDEHRITRKLVYGPDRTSPLSLLPYLRQPDSRRSHILPERQELRDPRRRLDALEPLVPHPLGRQLGQPLHVRFGGLERSRVDAKP